MTGRLDKITSSPLKSGVQPLSVTSENGDWRCADPYSTVANWPYYYAIGNCPNGAELEVVSYASEDPTTHEHSYGGFVNGTFSGCGWINTAFPLEKLNSAKHTACAEESGGGFKVKESSFWETLNSSSAQDGFYVVNKTPCPEYANYRPWSESNAPKELIRTVPAYEREGLGEKAGNPALKWRYLSKYASVIEPKVKYVMVRDDRIAGGEGNWVFVPRSCLPATLPTSEGEHLPPAPTVTTDGASSVATPDATLNATVDPNGVETKYYFEYGTTTSYGSYTATANAGAGTSSVPVHAEVTGLAAGTTYYFRIVASSAIGASFGGPVAFTTQPPPTVTTNAASGVLENQATLNGTVNPNGLETKYHFEYGETTSYGTSTPDGGAGSGTSTMEESAVVSGLAEGRTYDYRLVATSPAGTTDGANQTVNTLEREASSHWAVLDPETADQWVYHVGSIGAIGVWFWNTREWSSGELAGHAAASGSSPTVVRDPSSGDQWVYYQGSNGAINLSTWNTHEWSSGELAGHAAASGSSPTVVREPKSGDQWVYYQGSNGAINLSTWNTHEWSSGELAGHAAASGSSPTVVRDPSSGDQWVYYQGSNGAINLSTWNTHEWSSGELAGHAAASGSSPTVVREPKSGDQWVYYQGSNGAINLSTWNTHEWSSGELAGHAAASGSSPTVVRDPSSGDQWVYYQGSNGAINLSTWNTHEWSSGELAGHAAASGSSPTVVRDPSSGDQWVYYQGSNGAINLSTWNTHEWSSGEL